jgi:hypothetical protein
MTESELVELLAEKEHESWSRWMAYLFSRCTRNQDDSFTIFTDFSERWTQQIATPYSGLSEQEKQSDRDEVTHILPIINKYIEEQRS